MHSDRVIPENDHNRISNEDNQRRRRISWHPSAHLHTHAGWGHHQCRPFARLLLQEREAECPGIVVSILYFDFVVRILVVFLIFDSQDPRNVVFWNCDLPGYRWSRLTTGPIVTTLCGPPV
jgi:hypothetical protein